VNLHILVFFAFWLIVHNKALHHLSLKGRMMICVVALLSLLHVGENTGEMEYYYSRSPLSEPVLFFVFFWFVCFIFSCRGEYTGELEYYYSRSPLCL